MRQSMDRMARSLHDELATCPSAAEVQALMDGRMAEIKEFVGKVCKTVPRPARIETSRKVTTPVPERLGKIDIECNNMMN